MPRSRTNDPLGVSDHPTNVVTDPARIEAVTNEFKRRLIYLRQGYLIAVRAIGGDQAFNASLARLQRSLARTRPPQVRGVRAHPELELVISEFARRHAAQRTGNPNAEVTQEDAQAGAKKAAEMLKPRRGRSRNTILRQHVEGVMAAIQEAVGKPVLLPLQKDNHYDPQAIDAGGRVLIAFFQEIDPNISVTTLASMVKAARRKYAGKPMRFADMFPLYGMGEFREDGTADLQFGARLEAFTPNIPIYFP